MGITIQPQQADNHFWVNGKSVYKDLNDNWVCDEELTTGEQRAFREYRDSLQRCKA